jgi:hypothetical protein
MPTLEWPVILLMFRGLTLSSGPQRCLEHAICEDHPAKCEIRASLGKPLAYLMLAWNLILTFQCYDLLQTFNVSIATFLSEHQLTRLRAAAKSGFNGGGEHRLKTW